MNGLTGLVVTKLDVLTGIDPLHVAVRYLGPEGATFDDFPYHQSIVHRVHGDYVELPGWHEDIRGCRSIDELPANAQAYLEYISDFLGVPIVLVAWPRPRADDLLTEPPSTCAERLPSRSASGCLAAADTRGGVRCGGARRAMTQGATRAHARERRGRARRAPSLTTESSR